MNPILLITSYTDLVLCVSILVYAYFGFRGGFLRSLMAPVSMLVCLFLSYRYYLLSHDMITALMIGIAGPIVLKLVFVFIGKLLGAKSGNLSILSRLLGAGVCLVWVSLMLVLMIFLVALAPPNITAVKPIKNDVLNSKTFKYFIGHFQARFPHYAGLMESSHEDVEPPTLEEIQSFDEYHELMKDERIQALLENEEIMEAIRNKEIAPLLNNEKMFEILQDRELVEKFLSFYLKLGESNALEGGPSMPKTTGPLIINIPHQTPQP